MLAADEARNSATPPIGVAIPTFNRSDVLLRCFEHLEAQVFSDFEVIVVDDGSTDATAEVLQQYAARTPLRFRYVRQQNMGPAGARNHAVSLLRAPVCLLIGDDILASPKLVQQHLDFHQQHPQQAAFALGYTRWAQQGQTVTPFMQWLERDTVLQFAYCDLLRGKQPTWEHFYTSNLSGKTAHMQANPFDETFPSASMEDIELGYRLSRRGGLDIHFLPDALAEHVHPTDVAHTCGRMLASGRGKHSLLRMWPELAPAPGTRWLGRMKRRLLESGLGLGVLREAAIFATRFRCPNPLLEFALRVHHESGWRQAQAGERRLTASGGAPPALADSRRAE